MPDSTTEAVHPGKHAKLIEIARDLIDHVNTGTLDDSPLWDKHFAADFDSIEGDGMVYAGREAVQGKCEWFYSNFTVHSCKAEGPYLGRGLSDGSTGSGSFAVKFTIDCESKDGKMPRMTMDEIAYYTVENGKIVREEFMGMPEG
ncbi:MAG: nuclear transport factor 2 family protein [Planctomycetota bacterium]